MRIPVVNGTPICPVCDAPLEDRQRCPEGHVEIDHPVPTPPGRFCERHLNWGCWEDKLECWQEIHGPAMREEHR